MRLGTCVVGRLLAFCVPDRGGRATVRGVVVWTVVSSVAFVARAPCTLATLHTLKHEVVDVTLRDMYNDTRCLKCEDCEYHTVTKETQIIRLATKKSDGLKRETYKCAFCRVGREIDLPLYRPLDAKPSDADVPIADKLISMASDPKATRKESKLV